MAGVMRACYVALLLGTAAAEQSNSSQIQRCSISSGLKGKVLDISDGENKRCIAVVADPSAKKPLPVLFWFHGQGGNAGECGMEIMEDLESWLSRMDSRWCVERPCNTTRNQ